MKSVAVVLAALVWSACVEEKGFVCHTHSECSGGPGGACELAGFCSFTDSSCATGRRFAELSGSLSGQCVPSNGDGGDLDMAVPLTCGNGSLESPEDCDEGLGNSNDPDVSSACTTSCRKRAPCGDLTGSVGARIDPSTGHCYVAWPQQVDWMTAERACERQGGTLAVITTGAENTLVLALAGTGRLWVGLTSAPSPPELSQVFVWESGEPLAVMPWVSGQPDNQNSVQECVLIEAAGWSDTYCGYPPTGQLPASPSQPVPYVCEIGCGNSVVEPGEDCDPPGPACTSRCKTVRACDPPGVTDPTTGHCYFLADLSATVPYATAKSTCQSLGAHLATLNSPAETEAALAALAAVPQPDMGTAAAVAWIALPVLSGFPVRPSWDITPPEPFNSRRYHGYISPDPIGPSPAKPDATVVTLRAGVPDGWHTRTQTDLCLTLCERD